MNIITIPHPTLRKKAQEITILDKKMVKMIGNLGDTLINKDNPKGVGLAFPQVDKLFRVFVTYLNDGERDDKNNKLITFINPVITNHSQKITLGPDKKDPILEGCLSMPGIYGPVPRWEWVEVEYQEIEKSEKTARLKSEKGRFEGFHARVIQHELDHLEGILFTDHSLRYDLPVYQEKGKKFVEIDDVKFLHSF